MDHLLRKTSLQHPSQVLISSSPIWCLVAEFGNQKQMGCECAIATCIFMGFGMVKFMQCIDLESYKMWPL